jgi:hypothetical protein
VVNEIMVANDGTPIKTIPRKIPIISAISNNITAKTDFLAIKPNI